MQDYRFEDAVNLIEQATMMAEVGRSTVVERDECIAAVGEHYGYVLY